MSTQENQTQKQYTTLTPDIERTRRYKREDLKRIAEDEAKKAMREIDFDLIMEAIDAGSIIRFQHKNKKGEKKFKRGLIPIGFFITPCWKIDGKYGQVYLWGKDPEDNKKKQYYANTIFCVGCFPQHL